MLRQAVDACHVGFYVGATTNVTITAVVIEFDGRGRLESILIDREAFVFPSYT